MSTAEAAAPLHAPAGARERLATRAVFLVIGFTMAAWAPLVPFAKARLGVDDGTLGLLLLCLGLGSIVAMPVTGVLASRIGCRKVIVAAVTGVALVMPVLALADSAWVLGPALALFGAAVGTADVAINIQAVMVEKDSGRSLMSGFHGLFSLGGILGAGGVSLMLGLAIAPVGSMLATSVLALLVLGFAVPGLLPYGNRDQTPAPLFVVPRGLVMLLGILCFITFLAEGAILDWSAILLGDTQGADAAQAGLGYTLFAVAMTLGRFTGDATVQRLGGRLVMLAGGLVAAAGFVLAVLAPVLPLALLGFALVGLGAANIVPVLFSAAGRQTSMPASLAIAAVTTLGYAGILVGPAAIGVVAQQIGLPAALLAISAALVLVAALAPVATRR
jgi:predicted MFS family arabinose efflux permease